MCDHVRMFGDSIYPPANPALVGDSPQQVHERLWVSERDKRMKTRGGIAVWTWAMAVMMSSAMTYQWGLSGLFWFVVPNGFAVMAMIPFARILRRNMPEGYTISEFIQYRFNRSKVATGIVTLTMIFGIILEILINLKGTSVVVSTVPM